ncbi:MAG: acyltransferase [Hyphomicrobium sp.]|nr:acyltransferase [Hyphomicrobium sp.]MBZ0209646.1 acyltransferase [Hyphomicrobium sp.]MCZ7595822.1 acyltransferase [Hyphomicrobium sp.]
MAVFAFYVLSGYLITRVLNTHYMVDRFSWGGFGAFALNRVLRLWPAYLLVCVLSALLVERAPLTAAQWLTNLSVVGIVGVDYLHMASFPELAPNAWSLSIELVCYALLAFGFARSPRALLMFALLGAVALTASTGACTWRGTELYAPYCFQNRYGVLQAGFIPFAAGGLIYFYERRAMAFAQRWIAPIAAAGAAVVLLVAFNPALQFTLAPFAGGAFAALFLAWALARDFSTPITYFLGRASYHVFISHYAISRVLTQELQWERDNPVLLMVTLCVALLLGFFLIAPLERRIDAVRTAVRERAGSVGAPRPALAPG